MKDGDQSSVYLDSSFKPPDRSTSAPPVLSLQPQSLFAFRAAEHLRIFGDIRCEDNYYEFYNKYQNQAGGKALPPPLESQPFLMERPYHEDDLDAHLLQQHTSQQHSSHQQQLQQMQQQLQQQQLQMQQQQFQQQYLQQQQQQSQHQQYSHQQLPSQHQHHIQQPHQLAHQHSQHQQQQQQYSQLLLQQQLQQQHHPHQQQQQHQQHLQQLHQQQQMPHHRISVPDLRNPPQRSMSYNMRNTYADRFDSVPEEPTHISDDLGSNPANDAIWTPLPRTKVPTLSALEEYLAGGGDEPPQQQQQQGHKGRGGMPQGPGPVHGGLRNQGPLPPQASRDPNLYYQQSDFDAPYSSAESLLKDDDRDIQSLWTTDRGFDRQQPQYNKQLPPHITAPTPTLPSQSNLISLLGNGFFNEASTPADKMTARRRASSGGRISIPSLNHMQQDRNVGDVTFVSKPKPKKTVASPPPMAPKVPSPIHRLNSSSQNGSSHMNGSGPSQSGNGTSLSNLLASMSAMNLGNGPQGSTSSVVSNGMGIPPATSPQPIMPGPRSTTPNSSNGLDMAFNSGSTSPNGKSDLSRQYTSIEQVIGHIYSLCKDQHGCRFLQKKLEDRDPMVVEIIFNEVYDHMTELMIDPFGNYLCQKLLEHCNDEQRLHIIEKVAPDLVKISKNMHGTRAVQKMIEYLTTPEQIAIAKKALSNHVVTLIQDLNGNHVIQRCLNRLSPQDNQFIYDSVSQAGHCVEVATHRHGCCVLQRCIDHASDSQKIQLINEIIANALVLVQDPYGNYVVQYVLDLPFPGLASRLARRFLGHIPILSTQKFSSNVVEKCLNVTDIQTRASIIQELVEYDNLLYLLQDPYANYVIQTSLNVSEPVQHARLVEAIRPHLSSLRNTPYGKRIQNKILKESSRDYYA